VLASRVCCLRTEGDPASGEAQGGVDARLDGAAAALDAAEAAAPEAGPATGPRRGQQRGRVTGALVRGLLHRRRLRLRSCVRAACSINDELLSGLGSSRGNMLSYDHPKGNVRAPSASCKRLVSAVSNN